jgi:hypothetical protein
MRNSLRGAAAAVMLAVGAGAAAAADAPAPGLAEMLALLPDAPAIYEASPIFSYADMRAMERAGSAPSPQSEAAFDALPQEQQGLWVDATYRLTMGPQWLGQYFGARGPGPQSMAATVGFDMFAIDRSLVFGLPPGEVLVLAGDEGLADPARLQGALEPRGFALRQVGSVPVWHRFEDYRVNITERTFADPFGGPLGKAARVAVLPQMLVNAPAWPLLEAVLAAPRTEQRGGGALATMLRAAAAAAEQAAGPDALLVQAEALPLAATADAPPIPALIGLADPAAVFEALKARMAAAPADPALPPYPFFVIADLQDGDEQHNVIVLPYADAAVAATAGEALAERLRGWTVPGAEADGPLAAKVGGTVEARVASADGVSCAVVAVRYPLPDPAAEDAARPGQVVRSWMQAIYRREFTPLAVFP